MIILLYTTILYMLVTNDMTVYQIVYAVIKGDSSARVIKLINSDLHLDCRNFFSEALRR